MVDQYTFQNSSFVKFCLYLDIFVVVPIKTSVLKIKKKPTTLNITFLTVLSHGNKTIWFEKHFYRTKKEDVFMSQKFKKFSVGDYNNY